jgi:hypothetical protein
MRDVLLGADGPPPNPTGRRPATLLSLVEDLAEE